MYIHKLLVQARLVGLKINFRSVSLTWFSLGSKQ